MQSPHLRLSTIPVQPSFASIDVEIPEPPLTEAGKWTFHSQKELPPPPPFEKRLRRYPTGAETGCCKFLATVFEPLLTRPFLLLCSLSTAIPLDLSHLRAFS